VLTEEQGITPTDEQKTEIMQKLEDAFPLIKAPNAKDREDGAIEIVKSGSADVPEEVARAQAKVNKSEGYKGNTVAIQLSLRELESAVSSGAVLPTHFTDGSIIGPVMAQYQVLGIHDALVTGIATAEDVVKAYNTNMYETLKGYNLLDEVTDSLHRSLSTLTPAEVAVIEDGFQFIVDNPKKDRGAIRGIPVAHPDQESSFITLRDSYKELSAMALVNTKKKKELFDDRMIVSQIPLTDGSVYDSSKDGSEVEFAGKDSHSELEYRETPITLETLKLSTNLKKSELARKVEQVQYDVDTLKGKVIGRLSENGIEGVYVTQVNSIVTAIVDQIGSDNVKSSLKEIVNKIVLNGEVVKSGTPKVAMRDEVLAIANDAIKLYNKVLQDRVNETSSNVDEDIDSTTSGIANKEEIHRWTCK